MKGDTVKVLFAGETWITYETHIKGFDMFTVGKYGEGTKWLMDALERNGMIVDHIPNHLAPMKFPTHKEDIQKYDVIIFSDIGCNTLTLHPDTVNRSKATPNRLQLVKDFVRGGGGFIMIGGWMSFQGIQAKAHYKDTQIEDILPVTLMERDDRVEVPQGIYPEIRTMHPIIEGLPNKWPMLLTYNRIFEKKSAQVLAKYDKDPILVIWEYEKGRTAAFAADCAPHGASPEFLEWKYYPTLWSRLINWLAKKI